MTPQDVPPIPAKKGIPALGWVGIGCGTILIIAVIIASLLVGWCKRKVGDLSEFQRNPEKATAELVVRMSPDLTLVSQDESKGEMTIRTKDGETMTLSYKDVGEGKFRFKDANGNVTEIGGGDLSKLPPWVPIATGLKQVTTHHTSEEESMSGFYMGQSTETIDALDEFFKARALELDMKESNRSSTTSDGTETRTFTYEGEDRQLTIIVSSKDGKESTAQVSFKGGK